MTNEELKEKLRKQTEAIELTVVAYEALSIKKTLEDALSESAKQSKTESEYIRDAVKDTLLHADKSPFTEAQAEAFVNRYTPLAALDQDGAGAIILHDSHKHINITTIRGTDIKNNLIDDVLKADKDIVGGYPPVYQSMLIDNFLARETAPKGMPVSQLKYGMTLGRTQDALGTGRAEAGIQQFVAHSEGSPEATAMGALHKAPVITINGPGVNPEFLDDYVQTARRMTGRNANPVGTDALHIDTTGISIISQLNGGLPGEKTLSPTFASGLDSHSSVEALKASRWAEQLVADNPKIQTMEQVVQLSRLDETERQKVLEVFNQNDGATLDTAHQLVEYEKGRAQTTMSGYHQGEATYQNAYQAMQTANQQAYQAKQKVTPTMGQDHYDRSDALDNYKARARAEAQQPKSFAHEHNTHAIVTHLEARHDKQLKQKAEANAEFEREAHRHNPNQGQNHSDTKEQPHQPYGGSPDKYSPQSQADTPLTATQARAESADPRFTANFNKILTEIRDDPEVMAHLDAKGLSAPQSLNSIAAHAAHQSFANGAHPVDGVVMMEDGQLTVVFSPHKFSQDTYVFDMAQAATIDPKVSEQTANLALDNHTQEFAAVVAQYQIPGGMSHGMSLSSPSASGGDAGSVG